MRFYASICDVHRILEVGLLQMPYFKILRGMYFYIFDYLLHLIVYMFHYYKFCVAECVNIY